MNIFKNFLKNNNENQRYASTSRRLTAVSIDIWIVFFLRLIAMQILGVLWMNAQLINFLIEFKATFGTEEVKNTPQHINFIIHHQLFWQVILFYLIVIFVGAFYHAYLNSSKWQATIGKRLMKIVISTKTGLPISFSRGLLHYFLSLLPFIFFTYILAIQLKTGAKFFEIILGSPVNLILGIIFVLWIQIQAFTSNKTTVYDLICNTIFTNGKTPYKFPWSKN